MVSLPQYEVPPPKRELLASTYRNGGGVSPPPARIDPGNDVHEIAPATPPSQSRAVFCISSPAKEPILVLGSPVPVPVPVTNKLMQAADIASFLRAQRPALGIRDS